MKKTLELKNFRRSTELFLRALWGSSFPVATSDSTGEQADPLSYLVGNQVFLPARVILPKKIPAYYRAAATHAAAHAVYGGEAYDVADYNLMQRTVIGLVEDLRVEQIAIKNFPGLRRLWLGFHNIDTQQQVSAQQLMVRLSRAVLDEHYHDDHQWIQKAIAMIGRQHQLSMQASSSLEIGLALANDLGQMRLPLNSGRYQQSVLYRDDNRCLWTEIKDQHQQQDTVSPQQAISQNNSFLSEQSSGMQLRLSDNMTEQGEGFVIHHQNEADFEYREVSDEVVDSSISYPEWDYRSQVLKQDWCHLLESGAEPGSQKVIAEIISRHKHVLNRLRHIANRLRIERLQRIRKQEEGDEVDLDPMINAMVMTRSGQMPDTRVFMRHDLQEDKNLAISILLDLSESTNKTVSDNNIPVYQLLRDAVLLLGETLSTAGEAFAISGFSSNGRQQIKINSFKTFSESFEVSKSRLATIAGGYSTRLGAAIRHSAQQLAGQPQRKKLLLVITDGVPSDIDVYDSRYLVEDSWQAVHALSQQGIRPFCLNLDSQADSVMEHVFGQGRFVTLDRLVKLPEVLSYIYIKYMRH